MGHRARPVRVQCPQMGSDSDVRPEAIGSSDRLFPPHPNERGGEFRL